MNPITRGTYKVNDQEGITGLLHTLWGADLNYLVVQREDEKEGPVVDIYHELMIASGAPSAASSEDAAAQGEAVKLCEACGFPVGGS